MIILFIYNEVDYHYEIIESIIVNYHKIIKKLTNEDKVNIYLECHSNKLFEKYITERYPNIKWQKPDTYDYFINCTIYEKDLSNNLIKLNSDTHYYISHEITDKLLKYDNIYYLTELAKKNVFHATLLPFSDDNNNIKKDKTKPPVFIVQGTMLDVRRNFNLLKLILSSKFEYDFTIKLVGKKGIPKILLPFENKIIVRQDLNFIDFHKEFLDCYCILPLTTKKSHPQYYINKLTSSINYVKAYKVKCLIDKDLQDIYHLDNVEVFNNEKDIVRSFSKILKEYYDNN